MRFTVRLDNDRYLDLKLDVSNRKLYILSPIPDIDLSTLMKISDDMRYRLILPITGNVIEPDKKEFTPEENENSFMLSADSAIMSVLLLANTIITGDMDV